jgi:hypothetical protein
MQRQVVDNEQLDPVQFAHFVAAHRKRDRVRPASLFQISGKAPSPRELERAGHHREE